MYTKGLTRAIFYCACFLALLLPGSDKAFECAREYAAVESNLIVTGLLCVVVDSCCFEVLVKERRSARLSVSGISDIFSCILKSNINLFP